ncbi:GNAT family N-acetyltransferase [Sedimentitalea sp. CY04]|uniref:GNAT family N-acetyltransferase n=1 Tax=Parasedimentitalea denitrificans TaxID=2211118 RepID=A0ABX0W8R0_9RHOB|nr:GNAT family N-acetyltransferase [Sedimentitalea sp. CY04]NIZ62039.1 GNAT family N-acetyltransferase [Sedimentitalea sp. CY04]
MIIRPSTPSDAAGISRVLIALTDAGLRRTLSDTGFALSNYIENPNGIECSVATDAEGSILGFQALLMAVEGNQYGVTPGWGVIGTHIHPEAIRQGIGGKLFTATRSAAVKANLKHIDATIQNYNTGGLAYYESVGFRTYETIEGAVRKVYDLS